MRRLTQRRRRDERGAVALITAVFVAAIVIPACLITIDVGRVYTERRQLQNGADAAALAVAQSCVEEGGCDTSYADRYADPNANDDSQDIIQVCGTALGVSCTSPGGPISNCPPIAAGSPLADAKYVQVNTRVEGPDGLVLVPLFGADPTTVTACARAALGGARTATGLAFTISFCEWRNSTSGGTKYGKQIDISLPDNKQNECLNSPGGGWGDNSGSFGWLDDQGGCQATVDTDGTYDGDTGNNFPQSCQGVMAGMVDSGEPIFVPVFDGVQGTGDNTRYRFKGWAAFVLLGYDLNGGKHGEKCLVLTKPCMTGYFTEALITDPEAVLGGEDYGATLIGLTG